VTDRAFARLERRELENPQHLHERMGDSCSRLGVLVVHTNALDQSTSRIKRVHQRR
jgi:hypothetical protein